MAASEIVECSVNKTYKVAKEQLVRYRTEFADDNEKAFVALVTGNELIEIDEPHFFIDLNKAELTSDFILLGRALLKGIIPQTD